MNNPRKNTMSKQTVSILCPSYNHEKYVKYFLDSLLAQTNPNWELIIVDDCSTDNNVAEIKKYTDKRIKLIQNPFNMGINCGLNRAFAESNGQYISFCASDDMLKPDYVENVFNCFKQNPNKKLLYCDLQIMNPDGNPKKEFWHNPRINRYAVLNQMFFQGNCLLSPGMVIRRDLFKKFLPLDIPLSQYQDYKMHIDLLLQSDFMMMDKISVLYRKPNNQSGLSAFNDVTARNKHLEENLLMDSFLQIHDVALLKRIFTDDLKPFGTINKETLPFILGMLAINLSHDKYKKIWGYNQIVKFINCPKNYQLVNKLYGFSYSDFLNLAHKFGKNVIQIKYQKYKHLFNASLFVIGILFIVACILIIDMI